MRDLFLGTGIAHSILLFAVVIASGLWFGRFKIKGVSIGSTWILFLGILLSHFGFRADPTVLAFMKDFGLILFVFCIGLQVGPGFFHSFRASGIKLNLLAVGMVVLAILTTLVIHWVTGEELGTMVGVMSGAVTNTPGLGAAQQTLANILTAQGAAPEVAALNASSLASSYAIAYPLGVLGVIAVLILLRPLLKVDLQKEKAQLEEEDDLAASQARRMHCEVENPAIFGKTLSEVKKGLADSFVVTRLMRGEQIFIPHKDTTLQQGDKVLIVTSQSHVDAIRIIFGEEVPLHLSDWKEHEMRLVSKRLTVSRRKVNGKTLRELNFHAKFGVQVSRILRTGLEIVAKPNIILQTGDILQVLGPEDGIKRVEHAVGNNPDSLSRPNLVFIFFGIALGVLFGSVPIHFPGIPQPVKLGLAGGPLIIAIILGAFGPKWKISTYTTVSANMMLREIGISFFLAAVGLGAGETFVSSLLAGGYWWILYGFLITVIPCLLTALIARLLKVNFYQICGLIAGGMTSPASLAYAQDAYGSDHISVNYATVYPLTMFLRVLAAQMMILFAFA
ncbi:MAG: putative transporter [Bacteroidales bacterium]|nr:putative transporter [Bacteroidales bacterium]